MKGNIPPISTFLPYNDSSIFMPTPIDSASIWLSKLLMENSEHDADRAVVGQLEADLDHRSLDDALGLLDIAGAEEAGEFGLNHATFFLFPLVMPAVHAFIKLFVKKFIEDAASETGFETGTGSEAGKISAAALKNRVGNVLGNLEGKPLQQQALADLEQCFAERAAAIDFPKSSYDGLFRQMRNNPRMFL